MTAARFYSSTAGSMELQADITNASTTIQVDSTVGLPGTTPFTLVIDPGSTEEIVDVTGVAGTSLTIQRGKDGSPAQAHTAGAVIRHMATARDFRDAQEHIGNTAAHGTAGAVVGTTDAQTLTNKNLTSGTNTFPSSLATSTQLTAHTSATATHGATGAIVGTTNTQAILNKDLTSTTNSFPSTLATTFDLGLHIAATTGVHGITGNIVGTSDTQALSNKNLTAGSNTFPGTLVDTTTSGQVLNRDLPIGDLTSSTSRVFQVRRRAFTGTKQYQSTWYIQSGDANGNTSLILEENGTEVGRVSLRFDGHLQVTTGNIQANNIPTSGVAGTSTTKASKRLHWGTFSGTTDTNGFLTVTHGAGFTPVMAKVELDTALQHAVDTKTATTFRVRVVASDGTNIGAPTAIAGSFICGE